MEIPVGNAMGNSRVWVQVQTFVPPKNPPWVTGLIRFSNSARNHVDVPAKPSVSAHHTYQPPPQYPLAGNEAKKRVNGHPEWFVLYLH